MMENDTQNSQQAASTALHNAPKLAKIAQAGVQGGPAGAATEAAVQYCKEILVVAIAVLLLPVLVLLMLPGAIFGTLTQPSTAVNDDLEVAANVMQLRNAVSDILQVAYEDTLAEIESERASLTYSDIDDSVGGHVSYNAFQLISMYSAYQGEDDYTKISLADLSAQVQAHRTEYYTYTTSEEVRTEPVQKEVRGQTITVQEDHTYTVFTLSYVGDDYFADTVWQLDDKQKSCADAYAHNLTVYLHEIEEHEGITILGKSTMHLLMIPPLLRAAGSAIHSMTRTGNSTLLLSSANARMSAFPARIPPTTMAWTLPIPMAHQFWQWRAARSLNQGITSVMEIIWSSTTAAGTAPFMPIAASFWLRLAIR